MGSMEPTLGKDRAMVVGQRPHPDCEMSANPGAHGARGMASIVGQAMESEGGRTQDQCQGISGFQG